MRDEVDIMSDPKVVLLRISVIVGAAIIGWVVVPAIVSGVVQSAPDRPDTEWEWEIPPPPPLPDRPPPTDDPGLQPSQLDREPCFELRRRYRMFLARIEAQDLAGAWYAFSDPHGSFPCDMPETTELLVFRLTGRQVEWPAMNAPDLRERVEDVMALVEESCGEQEGEL